MLTTEEVAAIVKTPTEVQWRCSVLPTHCAQSNGVLGSHRYPGTYPSATSAMQ